MISKQYIPQPRKLMITGSAAPEIRATLHVDAIIQVASRGMWVASYETSESRT